MINALVFCAFRNVNLPFQQAHSSEKHHCLNSSVRCTSWSCSTKVLTFLVKFKPLPHMRMSFFLWNCFVQRLIFFLWLAPASFFCILCPSPRIWDPQISICSVSPLRWSCSPIISILSTPLAHFPKLGRLWSHPPNISSGVGAFALGVKRPGRVADHPNYLVCAT
jgi:hypothetical protein